MYNANRSSRTATKTDPTFIKLAKMFLYHTPLDYPFTELITAARGKTVTSEETDGVSNYILWNAKPKKTGYTAEVLCLLYGMIAQIKNQEDEMCYWYDQCDIYASESKTALGIWCVHNNRLEQGYELLKIGMSLGSYKAILMLITHYSDRLGEKRSEYIRALTSINYPGVYYYQALQAFRAGDMETANVYYLTGTTTGVAEAYNYLAEYYIEIGKIHMAVAAYDKAHSMGDMMAGFHLGYYYEKNSNEAAAIRYYRESLNAGNPNAGYNLALLKQNKDKHNALRAAKNAYKLGSMEAGLFLAVNYLENQNMQGLQILLQASVTNHPDVIRALAKWYEEQDDMQNAVIFYRRLQTSEGKLWLSNYYKNRDNAKSEYFLREYINV